MLPLPHQLTPLPPLPLGFRKKAPQPLPFLGGRRWEGGDPGVSNQKTPTTILLTPERKFHSFGYAARDFYHDLDPNEAKQWLYLEKFKMKLHTTGVSEPLPGPESSTLDSRVPPALWGTVFPTRGTFRFLPSRNSRPFTLILETARSTRHFWGIQGLGAFGAGVKVVAVN